MDLQHFEKEGVLVEKLKAERPLFAYFCRFLGKRPIPSLWSVPVWTFVPLAYLSGFVGSFIAISVMALWDQYGAPTIQHRGIIFSFGATVVLLFAAPESPLSQPRNAIFGNIIACIVGLLFRFLVVAAPHLRWLASALAVSCSIVLMQITKTVHPPAGATALVAASTTDAVLLSQGWWMILNPVLFGMIVMILIAVLIDNCFFQYPIYWV